ncbi:unnamed protein product [Protopolystoma xenopodis]|uniref:Uncharacterized protein n=1 Tax=Protopolystoma xenopodis TaxID=117903 RepID=A0A448WHF3_9PLAT|nr:unnamed protein product [Protopolystoma xenopodis]
MTTTSPWSAFNTNFIVLSRLFSIGELETWPRRLRPTEVNQQDGGLERLRKSGTFEGVGNRVAGKQYLGQQAIGQLFVKVPSAMVLLAFEEEDRITEQMERDEHVRTCLLLDNLHKPNADRVVVRLSAYETVCKSLRVPKSGVAKI